MAPANEPQVKAAKNYTKGGKEKEPQKFKRSRDRCHIINMVPVFDQHANVLCYAFRYTAGTKFEIEKLEPRHVMHVLIGYYVRRAMNIFVGDKGCSMVRLPLAQDSLKYFGLLNTQRFILYLDERQDVTVSTLHQIDQMHRSRMRIACDVYTVIYTRWAQAVKNFNYLVVDMKGDVNEQMNLAYNIRERAPWLKIIGRCENITNCRDAFAMGIEYVSCSDFPAESLLEHVNRQYSEIFPAVWSDVCAVFKDHLSLNPESEHFIDMLRRYPTLRSNVKELLEVLAADDPEGAKLAEEAKATSYESALSVFSPGVIRTLETVLCLKLLASRFEPDESRTQGVSSFEPLKFALIDGRAWTSALTDKMITETIPMFTLGVCRTLSRFTVSPGELNDPAYTDLMDLCAKTVSRYKSIAALSKGYEALLTSNLNAVTELAKEGCFTTGSLSGSVEYAIIWTQKIIKASGGWNYDVA